VIAALAFFVQFTNFDHVLPPTLHSHYQDVLVGRENVSSFEVDVAKQCVHVIVPV